MKRLNRKRKFPYHSDGLRSENFRDRECRVERDVGEDVDEGHEDAGDGDSARKVPGEAMQKFEYYNGSS